jgi:flagellar motor switch protein FliN
MSDAGQPISAEAREVAFAWAESISVVLSQIAGSPVPAECAEAAPAQALPPAETDVHIVAAASGAVRGEMSLRLPRSSVLLLAQVLMGEAQDPAVEFTSGHGEAAEELFRQVAGHVTTALKSRWGEMQIQVQLAPAPSWAAGATGWIVTRTESRVQFYLEWQLSAALVAELRPAAAPSAKEAASANYQWANPSGTVPADKLDLFMEVELGVTLRFGGRRMLLREILELGPGAVVELDRQVQQPVDLLLEGKLIARGEVVVVDGNYGLRVHEVIAGEWQQQSAGTA